MQNYLLNTNANITIDGSGNITNVTGDLIQQTKIADLPVGGAMQNTDEFFIKRGSNNYKVTGDKVLNKPLQEVLVKTYEDLPVPVNGIQTLEPWKDYIFAGTVNPTTNVPELFLPNSIGMPVENGAVSFVRGIGATNVIYTGSEALWKNSVNNVTSTVVVEDLIFASPNALCMDLEGSPIAQIFYKSSCIITNSKGLGKVKNMQITFNIGSKFNYGVGLLLDNVSGATISNNNINPILNWARLDYDAQTTAFTRSNPLIASTITLTGVTSGATAVIQWNENDGVVGNLYLSNIIGTFQDNEIVTDSEGGSATVNGVVQKNSLLTVRGTHGAIKFAGNFPVANGNEAIFNIEQSSTGSVIIDGENATLIGGGVVYKEGSKNYKDVGVNVNDGNITQSAEIGAIEFINNSVETVTVNNVYTKVLGATFFNAEDSQRFNMPADGTLKYIGDTVANRELVVNGSLDSNSASADITVTIYKNGSQLLRALKDVNGVEIANLPIERIVRVGGTDAVNFTISTPVTISPNDEFELHLKTTSGAEQIVLVEGILSIV